MLKKVLIALAILGAATPPTEATASGAHGAHGARANHNHKQVAITRPVYRAVAPAPGDAFGTAILGAIYGYESDGYRTYGGDPCYVYNDRDWEFQRVC